MIQLNVSQEVYFAVSQRGQRSVYLPRTPDGLRIGAHVLLLCQDAPFQALRAVRRFVVGPAQSLPAGACLLEFTGDRS